MVIVGAGRVGGALHARAVERGVFCGLVRRDAGWEALDAPAGTPVILAVRNDDLDEVLARVPAHRRADLVFVQNGVLRDFLRERGLDGCTRGLLYFAVARRGDPITPGGPNPFAGPHAEAVAAWFRRLDLEALAVDAETFGRYAFEKLCWLAVFGALGELYRAPVGVIATAHRDEVVRMTDELRRVGRVALGVEVGLEPLVERMIGYALRIPDFPAAVKEWPWRNGWLDAAAARYGIDTSFHRDVICRIGKGSLLHPLATPTDGDPR